MPEQTNPANLESAVAYVAFIELPNGYHKFIWTNYTIDNELVQSIPTVTTRNSSGNFTRALDVDEKKIVNAVSALRVEEIKEQLHVDSMLLLDDDLVKTKMIELAIMSAKGEFIGQHSSMGLYLQEISQILDISFSSLYDMAVELVAAKKLKLFGNIITVA